jgi:hypothetical protein
MIVFGCSCSLRVSRLIPLFVSSCRTAFLISSSLHDDYSHGFSSLDSHTEDVPHPSPFLSLIPYVLGFHGSCFVNHWILVASLTVSVNNVN